MVDKLDETAKSAAVVRSPFQQAVHRFHRNTVAKVGLVMIIILVLIVIIGPFCMKYDPDAVDLYNVRAKPSVEHLLGCDDLGRDLLTRLLHGGRISMAVGLTSALLSIMLGSLIGAMAGYYGGIVDGLLMRFTDLVLTIPTLPLLMTLAVIFKPSPVFLVVMIALLMWPSSARLVRSRFLTLRELDYVRAARATGESDARMILTHLLPNSLDVIIVTATLSVGNSIIMESTLSFLGCGINPPTASWGNMLQNAQSTMATAPLTAIAPGLMILLTVLAFNFLGDGLDDAIDPKRDKR
ncbi:ABC transporter permease [Coriobacteriales bacterium OH1046]|nr:ABC transporter permease [Coriobacteriales bacterium OH1046]